MSKEPIKWHEERFANWQENTCRKRAEAERLVAEAERAERQLSFYAAQIKEAQRRGMDGFDRDRFLVKRK